MVAFFISQDIWELVDNNYIEKETKKIRFKIFLQNRCKATSIIVTI